MQKIKKFNLEVTERIKQWLKKYEEIKELYKNRTERDFIGGLICSYELDDIKDTMSDEEVEQLHQTEEYKTIPTLIDKYDLYDM